VRDQLAGFGNNTGPYGMEPNAPSTPAGRDVLAGCDEDGGDRLLAAVAGSLTTLGPARRSCCTCERRLRVETGRSEAAPTLGREREHGPVLTLVC
jgi:hypothetical protein